MRPIVRSFLQQIVDYAGLFPPAKLPMELALNDYLRDRKSSPHQWMLGRFVCPTPRLRELSALAKVHPDGSLLQVAALGQQSANPGMFLDQLRADIVLIEDFRAGWGSDAVLDVIETPLPKSATIAMLQPQLANIPQELAEAALIGFLEVPMSASWMDDVAELARVLHEFRHTQPNALVGMKLRCGGLTAEAFPSDAQVATFIARCSAAHLPWKATAGLHHPRRHWDDALRVWHHGFLNVFLAGALAMVHSLTEAEIVQVLADRNGEFFRFEDGSITWLGWSVDAEQVAQARQYASTTFGSCSFEEPCVDLSALGLLDQ